MNQIERSDKNFDEREHIWITIDVKSLPSTTRSALAADTTDANVLDILADFQDFSNKLHVARNPYTLGKTLKRLAKETFVFIKEAVAEHPNTFPETLADLAQDENEMVRVAVASNMNTPINILKLKLFDRCIDVVIAAIRNPMTPKENIEMLIGTEDFLIDYEARMRVISK